MIEIENTFSLGGVKSSLCMKYTPVGHSTQAVLAVIRHRGTHKRQGPPECGNGFQTAYLPFAKGHVVALELGGSDASYNVVPQFEDWQGKPNGAWRKMEIELQKQIYADHIMLVEIGYDRIGIPEDPETAIADFAENQLRAWTDPRIPDSFDIKVWKTNLDVCGIANDVDFDNAVHLLKTKSAVFSKTFTLGNEMPQPDRANYITQFGITRAIARYEEFKKIQKQASFVSYMLEPNVIDEIRDDLMELDGIAAPEAFGMQAEPIMCGYQAGLTGPKIKKKLVERGRQNRKSIHEKDLWKKRDDSPKRKKK